MARSRFCRACKDFHDLEAPWPAGCASHFATESAGAGEARFYVISDSIAPFRSMADGRFYDSKSAYRGDLKRRGLIEVGNESRTPTAPKPVDDRAARRAAIRQSISQLGG